jgi:hypothetical protein
MPSGEMHEDILQSRLLGINGTYFYAAIDDNRKDSRDIHVLAALN